MQDPKFFVLHAALLPNAVPNCLKSSPFISQFQRVFMHLLDDLVSFGQYRACERGSGVIIITYCNNYIKHTGVRTGGWLRLDTNSMHELCRTLFEVDG